MAEVTLTIGGRSYNVACRDGGEGHLLSLATRVDAKVAEAKGAVGTASEVRQLLFAALLLADDVAEGNASPSSAADAAVAGSLALLATRVESIADALESTPAIS